MSNNFAVIVVRPNVFEVRPPHPEVTVGFEPFVIGIDWDDNRGAWTSVRVENFARPNGDPVAVQQTNPVLTLGGATVNVVTFLRLPALEDTYYKYDLVYTRADGSEFTLDPTLMVRRVG